MPDLPHSITNLVDELAAMPGVIAVVLGGSRALGTSDAASDWDLGVYYRGSIDLTTLAARGVVHAPGSWGRIMNGGAWLQCGDDRVDVLLRDLDVVEHWSRRAADGEFDVDALLGYVAGVPTYLLCAELASGRTLRGAIPPAPFPPMLATTAPPRWRFCRSFSLAYARTHAARGARVGAIAQAAKAVMEEAHAVLCERRRWECNEKRLIEAAGLDDVQALFGEIPGEPGALVEWVDRVAARLGVSPGEAAPWNGERRPNVDFARSPDT